MKTCSETIKACGLKSSKQVADLNGVNVKTIQRAYNDNYPKFKQYIFTAIDELYEHHKQSAESQL